jgi:hypothetical protein
MATNSLPKLTEFRPISVSAVHVLARLAARRAVQEELRSQGVRVSLVKPAEIAEKAKAYLDANPRLYEEAYSRAWRMGLIKHVEPAPVCEIQWTDQNGNIRSSLMSLKYTSENVRHWRPLKPTC